MSTATSAALYFRLVGYVRPYWKAFAASIVGIAMKPFLDGTFVHKDPFVMKWIPLGVVGAFLVRGIGSFLGSYAIDWVGNKVVQDLRSEMFGKILRLPTPFFDNHRAWRARPGVAGS